MELYCEASDSLAGNTDRAINYTLWGGGDPRSLGHWLGECHSNTGFASWYSGCAGGVGVELDLIVEFGGAIENGNSVDGESAVDGNDVGASNTL